MHTNTASGNAIASVGFAALLPGIDLWTLLCACAGALLFVVSAKDTALWERIIYLPVGTLGGYVAAAEIKSHFHMVSLPLAAFFGGLLIIVFGLRVVLFVQRSDPQSWFRRR